MCIWEKSRVQYELFFDSTIYSLLPNKSEPKKVEETVTDKWIKCNKSHTNNDRQGGRMTGKAVSSVLI